MNTPEPTTITITTKMWDEIHQSWQRTVRSLVVLVLVVVLVMFLGVGFLGLRSYQSQTRGACTARIEGKALGLAFTALAAPPAPNPARGIAVKRGLAEANKLENLDDYC